MADPIESDEQIAVPRDIGRALKAIAAGTADRAQQQKVYGFILHGLSAVDRSSFAHGADTALLMAWREGRRFVGRQMRRIVETPIPDAPQEAAPGRPAMRTTTDIVEGMSRTS